MTPATLRRRGAAVSLLAAALVVALPTAALADTSKSDATAVRLTLVSAAVVTSGTQSASNDGQSPTSDSYATPALSVLGAQSTVQSGVLAQRATAFNDGSSIACAGLVGTGGAITVAPDNTCQVNNGSPDGIRINLGAATLRADAIVASCRAKSDGTVTANASIVNARVVANVLGTTLATIPSAPTPNSGLTVTGIATLGTNVQSSPEGAGSVRATALTISLLSVLSVADVSVGTVDCGLNVVSPATPALPWPVVPVVAVAVVLAAVSPWGRRMIGRARHTLV